MKTLCLILAICFFNLSYSQTDSTASEKEVRVIQSEIRKLDSRQLLDEIGTNDSSVFLLYKDKTVTVEAIDFDLKNSRTLTLKSEFGGDKLVAESAFVRDNEIQVFYSALDSKNKRLKCYHNSYDAVSFEEMDSLYVLAEIDMSHLSKLDFVFDDPSTFKIVHSKDKSKVLLFVNGQVDEKGEAAVQVQVYNSQMDILWKEEYTWPYADQKFVVDQIRVSREANVYVGVFFLEEKAQVLEDKRAAVGYEVYKAFADGSHPKKAGIQLSEGHIVDGRFQIDRDENIYIAGYYSKSRDRRLNTSGIYALRLNADFSGDSLTKTFPMTDDFLLKGKNEKAVDQAMKDAAKGKEIFIGEVKVLALLPDTNGTFSLIGEQRNEWGTGTDKYYAYNDVLVSTFSSDAELENNQKLLKVQATKEMHKIHSSVLLANSGFFFVDATEVYDTTMVAKSVNQFMYNPDKECSVVWAQLDNGEYTYLELYRSAARDPLLIPSMSKYIDEHRVFLYNQYGKKESFVILELPH